MASEGQVPTVREQTTLYWLVRQHAATFSARPKPPPEPACRNS
jgi:hypothetical protein